ncbi:MAG: abortive phage resistance protein [Euryarchaeota archaeon HGW-Euryarchaeota-1]|nr:MAG: abortive phage resistance protein [Euryarchaeota archaeon HGW-Euryarchaeota-1]
MSQELENTELNKFYQGMIQDIKAVQLSDEDGGNTEQIFTQVAVDLLASAGETENVRLAYDQKALGTKNQHQINAYSISDNYETIDLFITVLKGTGEISKTTSAEIETASKRILNFFRKGVCKEYVDEIEESSPIFHFANILSQSSELKENLVRINVIILTDGIYQNDFPETQNIIGYNVYFRVVDITYLYNLAEKSHIPIEVDFKKDGFVIPCLESPSENEEYKSYLAIISGLALASIYERFGSRLLEQNVRSFLQFSGKINRGIRTTIIKEPHMFLAFNNGIAATAESIELEKGINENGFVISKVKDLQIVNGGQTIASIYHTLKKDKADLTNIFVQLKLSVIKNKENFSTIVSRIAEYANTQNKVSAADLSSNRHYHIAFEKLSRSICTPHTDKNSIQTKWFYERARGQYKNARLKEGFTKSRQKTFDLKNPKNQMFTKEELAKYINAYQEVYDDDKKLVVGPHFVIKNVKNYSQFIYYNTDINIENNNLYFEDTIAKAILYKTAEKIYGVKPNAIGDLRFITVPYSIAYFGFKTDYHLDLFKIWKNQSISDNLSSFLKELMTAMDNFLKTKSPESLIEMWARKEVCWEKVKREYFKLDFKSIKSDLTDKKNPSQRDLVSEDETTFVKKQEDLEKIKSVPPATWKKIEYWGNSTQNLSVSLQNIAYILAGKVRNNSKILEGEVSRGLKVLDIVIDKSPELLSDMDELTEKQHKQSDKSDISVELISKVVQWDIKNKRLKPFEYKFMRDLAEGNKSLSVHNKKIAKCNLEKVRKYGFTE